MKFAIILFLGLALNVGALAQCTADFDTTTNGLTVDITNQASGSYNFIEYYFSDGTYYSNVSSPSHTFASAGVYEVCQTIFDTINFTCFDDYCDTLYMGGATCASEFFINIDQLDVEFFNVSIGEYDSIWYDFGDGNGSNNESASHSYTIPGVYTVCLSLYDSTQLCDSTCYTISVTDEDCDADFSFEVDDLTVEFTNESTGPFNAQEWDFDDGFGFSEESDPTYTYFLEGTYEVCLYVYDSVWFSCESDHCEFVTVEDNGGGGGGPCEAEFTYTADQLKVSFTNMSFGGLITTWDFGDSSGPNFDDNPVHEYDEPGEYEVCVTVFNPFPFCTDEYCLTIEVFEYTCEPEFSYSYQPTTNAFTFVNNTTVGNVTAVEWSFGDGNTSAFEQPIYTYNEPGVYKVCLTTFDEGNECGITCRDINVYPLGADQLSVENTVKIYPNPNNGAFTIELGENSQFFNDLIIRDIMGRIVVQKDMSQSQARIELDLKLPAGAYIFKLSGASGNTKIGQFMVK